MINPILVNIADVYQWFWIGVFVLFVVDWSFGFDKVSDAMNKLFDFYGRYVPIESSGPLVLLTVIGCFCKLMTIPFDPVFFGLMANLFGVLVIAFIVFMVGFAVLIKGLTKLRNTSIARREEKARKKSLTDSE